MHALKTKEINVETNGELDLHEVVSPNAVIYGIEWLGAHLRRGEEGPYTMAMPHARLLPGSDMTFEHSSAHYYFNAHRVRDCFETSIQIGLSRDGRWLKTNYVVGPNGDEWSPAGLSFAVLYDQTVGEDSPIGELPEYQAVEKVNAARIMELDEHPTMPGYSLVITEPVIEGIALSNLFISTAGVVEGGYLVFSENSEPRFLTAEDFARQFSRIDQEPSHG